MVYIPSLNKVQVGLETTYGASTTATIQLPGITDIQITPKVEAEQLIDKRGSAMPSHESFIKRRWVEGSIEGYANYTEMGIWLNGMFGQSSVSTGVSTYMASDWSTAYVEKSLTLQYGQDGLTYTAAGVLPYDLTISGATGEPVTFASKFFGQSLVDTTTFAALSDDTVVWMMGPQATIYLDAGTTIAPGTTPMTDIGFRFAANILSNRVPVWHLGNQQPDSWRNGKWGGSMNLVLEAESTALAHLGSIIDAVTTPIGFAVRIRITNASQTLDLDFVGEAIVPPNVITDLDGTVTVELNLLPTYGGNAAMLTCWHASLTSS